MKKGDQMQVCNGMGSPKQMQDLSKYILLFLLALLQTINIQVGCFKEQISSY